MRIVATSSPTRRSACRSSIRSRSPATTWGSRRTAVQERLHAGRWPRICARLVEGPSRRVRAASARWAAARTFHGDRERAPPAICGRMMKQFDPQDEQLGAAYPCQTSGVSLIEQDLQQRGAHHHRGWLPCSAARGRCTPTRSTRTPCRHRSPLESRATPSSSRKERRAARVDPAGRSRTSSLTNSLVAQPKLIAEVERWAAMTRRSNPACPSCASREARAGGRTTAARTSSSASTVPSPA
jgi:hypothetical protein